MGRAQFERVIAAAPREQLRVVNANATADTAVGGTTILEIYAPIGKVARLCALTLKATPPTGAASGTHQLIFQLNQPAANTVELLTGTSPFSQLVTWKLSHWEHADTSSFPPAPAGIIALTTVEYDWNIAVRMVYVNNTNVVNNALRTMIVVVVEREVGV